MIEATEAAEATSAMARNRSPLAIVSLALFFIPLTITASSALNPAITAEFSSGYARSQWVINAFMVSYSSCMTLTGAFADAVGRKATFVFGLGMLFLFSLLAAHASSPMVLIVARALTGVGAAAITTAGTAIIASEYTGRDKATAFSIFGSALGLGLAVGPLTATGLIELTGTWRSFFSGSALALLALCLAAAWLPSSEQRAGGGLDWIGGLLFTAMLTAAVSAITVLPEAGASSRLVAMLLAVFVALLAAFVIHESRVRRPIVEIAIFRNGTYLASCLTTVFLAFGYIAVLFYLPAYLLSSGSASYMDIGRTLTWATLPCFVVPILVARLRRHTSTRSLTVLTYGCLILGPLSLALALGSAEPDWLGVPLFITGASFGFSLSFLDGAAVSTVEPRRSGTAAGMFNTFRLGGESIMIPAMGAVIAAFFPVGPAGGDGDATRAIQGIASGARLAAAPAPHDGIAAFSHAFACALLAAAAVGCVGLVVSLFLLKGGRDAN